jgi:hypothetical protein
MNWSNAKSVEARIRRLTKEIAQIDTELYGVNGLDGIGVAAILERKRDDIARSAVLAIHTAIDDLLTQLILGSSRNRVGEFRV